MNAQFLPVERHICPDCRMLEAQGMDRFGLPMPCVRCVVARLLRAYHADQVDQPRKRPAREVWARTGNTPEDSGRTHSQA